MGECLRCRNCAPLEPLPKGDPRRLQRGHRFRSVESKDECKYFEPEPDQYRIARRFETVKILRAAFDKSRIDKQLKAKQAKVKK